MKRTHNSQYLMERHYLDTHVWRDGVHGVILRCSTEDRTVCVDWLGSKEPEWVPVAVVKKLRSAMTRARNRQLALGPKQLSLRYSQ